jgi:hypothetical protein
MAATGVHSGTSRARRRPTASTIGPSRNPAMKSTMNVAKNGEASEAESMARTAASSTWLRAYTSYIAK